MMSACCSNKECPAGNDEQTDRAAISAIDCDVTLSGIHFTKCLNGADTLVSEKDGVIRFKAEKATDYFRDPNGEVLNNAPILLTEIDNTKPFTLQARVKSGFTKGGTYNAGVLFLYQDDLTWQKFCFEQDERGNHRVVTVRTIGTSDDNNSEIVSTQDYVYFKYTSDTKTIGSYFSLDGKTWTMVRLYKNEYPEHLLIGLCSQCPKEDGTINEFSELKLTLESAKDFRLGK